MESSLTFTQKLALGFGAVVLLTIVVAGVSVYALHDVVATKDEVIDVDAQRLVDSERLHVLSITKANEGRAYILNKDPQALERVRAAHRRFQELVETLRRELQTDEGRKLLEDVKSAEEVHHAGVERILALRTNGMPVEEASNRYDREGRPLREALDRTVDAFVAREERLLKEGRDASTEAANRAIRLVLALAAAAVLLAAVVAALLGRGLARQIATAVRHVQSSSAELQATAGEQATGAKEQATAMAEITTTISELLATSRQIAESAQRVASIAAETAGAARSGDQTVLRSQESVGAIRRQVELIVGHMLELGKKSQQIGGILEIINELAEQTNILAINATIEAAGAGEAGRRFAV
ncbi:MAG: methyl-accepting chemotaxis protein, partial [Anaeromyxobacteraceae bacterium]